MERTMGHAKKRAQFTHSNGDRYQKQKGVFCNCPGQSRQVREEEGLRENTKEEDMESDGGVKDAETEI